MADLTTAVCEECLVKVRRDRPGRARNRHMFFVTLILFSILAPLTVLFGFGADHYNILGCFAFLTGLPSLLCFLLMLRLGFGALFGSAESDIEAYHLQQAAATASSLLSLPANHAFPVRKRGAQGVVSWPSRNEGEWVIVRGVYEPPSKSKLPDGTGVWDVFHITRSSFPQSTQSYWEMDAAYKIDEKSPWKLIDGHG